MITIRDKLTLFRGIIEQSFREQQNARKAELDAHSDAQKKELSTAIEEARETLQQRAAAQEKAASAGRERMERESHRQRRLRTRGAAWADLQHSLKLRLRADLRQPDWLTLICRKALLGGSEVDLLLCERGLREPLMPIVHEILALPEEAPLPFTLREEAQLEGLHFYYKNGTVESYSADELMRSLGDEAIKELDKLLNQGEKGAASCQQ